MPQCAVITCGNNYRKASNVRYHRFPSENYIREHWKKICGRKDPAYNCQSARVCSLHFSRDNYEKDLEHELLGLPPRTRLKRGAYPDVDVPVVLPNLKKIMKQITGIKKKFNGKKPEVRGNSQQQQQQQQQNGIGKSKIQKKVLTKKPTLKSGLNVNERPVRKKKKTKKYETYERDRKSPTPEVRQETNLLLALGLTPVKKSDDE
ncbi:UNVERIFIED_CONTAM: hypothetical protein PYX00_005250 [Menopon gallinae]|uniref:THAP-type domain-containing protein n=1 Tax=Menopon gallinae TaxID=328185 RepID=A0AAW2HRT2_9NEOP